jgi:hypothetical protein
MGIQSLKIVKSLIKTTSVGQLVLFWTEKKVLGSNTSSNNGKQTSTVYFIKLIYIVITVLSIEVL